MSRRLVWLGLVLWAFWGSASCLGGPTSDYPSNEENGGPPSGSGGTPGNQSPRDAGAAAPGGGGVVGGGTGGGIFEDAGADQLDAAPSSPPCQDAGSPVDADTDAGDAQAADAGSDAALDGASPDARWGDPARPAPPIDPEAGIGSDAGDAGAADAAGDGEPPDAGGDGALPDAQSC